MKLESLQRREQLGAYLQHHYPNGRGVEVGVQRGVYSDSLLGGWYSGTLYSVDLWAYIDGYIDSANVSQEEQDRRYETAQGKLKVYGERSVILRAESIEAADGFDDGSLDFVYLDADHSYGGCTRDLEAWWPKVKEGGVMAGHDFMDATTSKAVFGVESAVKDFLHERFDEVVRILCSIDGPWDTWAIVK